MNSRRKMTDEAWAMAKAAYEAGESMPAIALRHKVATSTLHDRANKAGWNKEARKNAGESGLSRSYQNGRSDLPGPGIPDAPPSQPASNDSGLSLLGDSLRSLSEAPPEEFQAAAARVAQAAVALGFRDIPPPRTISELEKWVRLWRTFSGLDAKDSGAGAPAFQTPRSIRRASPVVDVPHDPAQGFEV